MPQLKTTARSRLVLLLFFVSLSFIAQASHLVGGFITYKCLGANQYEVTLRVYRDSVNGLVPYEDQADIWVFDSAGTLVQTLVVPKGPTLLVPIDTAGCVSVPPNLYIQVVDYIDTVTLPPAAGGYSLTYQQCCRNSAIANILAPTSQGSTYTTSIPANDQNCNSSPTFTEHPPIVLCLNRPLNLQIETVETDGDSLYYQICDILDNGGIAVSPGIFPPPYNPIPYNFILPANPVFTIDNQTGLLTGKPNQQGQYVVGICVEEWRNNVKLSQVQLDYQFNVTNCINIFSDIRTQAEDSTLFCQGLTMNFFSQSQNANSYFWDFGDTTTLADTSTLANPTYKYSAAGFYEVSLIAEPGDSCGDTARVIFEVTDIFNTDFTNAGTYCFSDQPISFEPLGNIPPGSAITWDFGPNASYPNSTLLNPPPVSWAKGGEYYVELTVKHGKCDYVKQDTVSIRNELVADMITPSEDSSLTCNGLSIDFTSQSSSASHVFWNFGDNSTQADTSTQRNPTYVFPKAGRYQVMLAVYQDSSCSDTLVFSLDVHQVLKPDIDIQGQFCFEAQKITLDAQGGSYPAGTDYTWRLGALAQKPLIKGSSATVEYTEPGKFPVSLTVQKGFCVEEIFDTIEVKALTVPVDAGDTQLVKQGDLVNLQSSPASAYYWTASNAVRISSPYSQATTVDLTTNADTVIFYVRVTDAQGCEGLDSTYVIVTDADVNKPPNYLSPNGDGRNDFFDLSGLIKGQDCGLSILNRWGSEVYHAAEYQNNWGGTDKQGRLLPDGTYYYIVFCYPEVLAKGPITIIRGE